MEAGGTPQTPITLNKIGKIIGEGWGKERGGEFKIVEG